MKDPALVFPQGTAVQDDGWGNEDHCNPCVNLFQHFCCEPAAFGWLLKNQVSAKCLFSKLSRHKSVLSFQYFAWTWRYVVPWASGCCLKVLTLWVWWLVWAWRRKGGTSINYLPFEKWLVAFAKVRLHLEKIQHTNQPDGAHVTKRHAQRRSAASGLVRSVSKYGNPKIMQAFPNIYASGSLSFSSANEIKSN